jgi:hypothetical protein
MAADLMTLDEAAAKAGYARGHAGNLRRAAATSKLRTIRRGWQRFTTQAWLDEYLAGLTHTNAQKRGTPRRPAGEEPS